MKSVVVSVPHGIVFILDPKNQQVVVLRHMENELVTVTGSCMSVVVQPEVDGDVEVSIGRGETVPPGLLLVAKGELVTPHGSLAVMIASDHEPLIECEVSAGPASLSVWVDDPVGPTRVALKIEKARPVPTPLRGESQL